MNIKKFIFITLYLLLAAATLNIAISSANATVKTIEDRKHYPKKWSYADLKCSLLVSLDDSFDEAPEEVVPMRSGINHDGEKLENKTLSLNTKSECSAGTQQYCLKMQSGPITARIEENGVGGLNIYFGSEGDTKNGGLGLLMKKELHKIKSFAETLVVTQPEFANSLGKIYGSEEYDMSVVLSLECIVSK